jgi:glycosyltransferase involved in cell wall biosynthesis
MRELPLVSIIVPCRNEEHFISKCLDSILASDYPKEKLEVLVIDGISFDGTNTILQEYAQRHPLIRVITNPRRITPVAFNIGIDHARGDLIMIMSAHATYNNDAIRKSVEYSELYEADNIGGVWKILPRKQDPMGNAIVAALSHRFGAGGAAYRISDQESGIQRVDTAAYGCYRREVFDRIGRYNEALVRNQDIELNLRLKNAGGTILLAPDIVVNYVAHTSISAFCRRSFQDGTWAILSFAYSSVIPVAWRHLVPLFFVTSLMILPLLGLWAKPFLSLLTGVAAVYFLTSLSASVQIAKQRRNASLLLLLPVVFAMLHLTYGVGSLWGCAKLLKRRGLTNLFVVTWNQAITAKGNPVS